MNVSELLQSCAGELANRAERDFIESVRTAWSERDMKSPIEQMLYCAMRFLQRENELPNPDPIEDPQTGDWMIFGFDIAPQRGIGKYRVDFLVSWSPWRGPTKEIIVECDSQEWHERTAKQRTYEKARDRFLAKKGYKVFHYTGAEIVAKPIKVATEILQEIGAI